MKHKSRLITCIVLVLAGLMVWAGSATVSASIPNSPAYQFDTPSPPTATNTPPTPPTATDVPPTATDTPPTATDTPPTATDTPATPPTATYTPRPGEPTATPRPAGPSATPRPPQGGGSRPQQPLVTPYSVAVGWYAVVVKPNGLNLGDAPGFDASHVQIVGKSSRVCVIGGPLRADSLWWWKFRTETGVEGWGVSDDVERRASDELCLAPAGTPTAIATPRPPTRQPVVRVGATATRTPTPVTPTGTSLTLALDDLGVHIVLQGETLFCLGRAYGISPWAIARRNSLASPNALSAGQILNIPAEKWDNIPPGLACPRQFEPPGVPGAAATALPTAAPQSPAAPPSACRAVHRVVSGDTLWSIARRYGGSPVSIGAVNGLNNLNLIFVGSSLCIP
ncbi:MAG: LysM peptidoglycan-binding domain-containing protein [Thermoflexales bacterium]|nr:LysM peptidoglycan-binding domain-containing protein [Thermoflexales bacterium]